MTEERSPGSLASRHSCAVVRLWTTAGASAEPAPAALEYLLQQPGLHRVGEALFAVTTAQGDPAVYDAALAWSETLRGRRTADAEDELRVLIAPGAVRLTTDGDAELELDPVSRDLAERPPELAPGVYLTNRAFLNLEYPVEGTGTEAMRTSSGITVPLVQAGRPRLDQPPWRNREVLGQTSTWLERTDITHLDSLATEPVVRVVGVAGGGKTRLVAESLRALGVRHVWLTTRTERLTGPGLAEQLLRHLMLPSAEQHVDPLHPRLAGNIDEALIRQALEKRHTSDRELQILNERALATLRHVAPDGGALALVIDDYHAARGYDADLIAELAAASTPSYRLLVLSRGGADWEGPLEGSPRIEVGPLGDRELAHLSRQLTTGFALPDAFAERFLAAVAGNPFALEEGLFALVHSKTLRRVYGSFFFAGDPEGGFVPSQRYIRHVDAEIGRLSESWPARLLALLESPAPPVLLAAASPVGAAGADPDWHVPLTRSGILASSASPWGDGVSLAAEGERLALAALLPENERPRLRRRVGRHLAAAGNTAEALWLSYKLLAGTAEATEPLLGLFAGGDLASVPPEELLAALSEELTALPERGGDPTIELELLWRLLPLARKMGTLRSYPEELRRGVELATADPPRLLALASIKAEMDQESGHHQEAEATIKRALEAAADSDPQRKALLLIQLGRLLIRQRRSAEARQLFTNVRQAVGASGSNPLAATCDFYLGNIALSDGELDQAHSHHSSALEERRRPGLERAAGSSLSALGAVAIARGNYPEALSYYRQAEEVLEKHGKTGEKSYALLGEARALNRLGDFTGASRPVRQALALREGRDDAVGEALARLAVAQNYLDIGQPDAALEQARKAQFQLNMISAAEHLADADALLGRIHLSQRRHDQAKRRLEAARDRHGKAGNKAEAAFDLAGLLEIALAREDAQAVRRHTTDLKNLLPELPSSDVSDTLSYRLYLGLEYLTDTGLKVGNPLIFLDRAYRGVLEKAEHLSHEQRQRYLFQIPDNQAILAAATEKGLAAAG